MGRGDSVREDAVGARSQTSAVYVQGIVNTLPESCQRLWRDHLQAMQTAPGSARKHQAWEGGYQDHLAEIFSLAEMLYNDFDSKRPLPFSLTSANLVLFLHDSEKPFKYTETTPFPDAPELAAKDPHAFKDRLIEHYGIALDDEQLNALKYVHGEGDDYSRDRVMGPLAVFCHSCDILSARLWFDEPRASGPLS